MLYPRIFLSSMKYDYNVAMLEMETKLTIGLNKMVLPICLPKPGDVEENLMVLQTKALKTVELKTINNLPVPQKQSYSQG